MSWPERRHEDHPRYASGQPVQLCAIDFLQKEAPTEAIVTIHGLSLCEEHANRVVKAVANEYTIAEILQDAIEPEEDLFPKAY